MKDIDYGQIKLNLQEIMKEQKIMQKGNLNASHNSGVNWFDTSTKTWKKPIYRY